PQRVHPEQLHRAGRRRQKPGQTLDRRRLPGAVGAEEAVHRPPRHFEVDSVDGDECPELPSQSLRMNGQVHGRILPGDPLEERHMLELGDLVKVYPGPVAALQGVTLSIPQGMFGLLGPNGAGKTTLMRIVAGLLEPTSGRVVLDGDDVTEKPERIW